MSSLEAVDHRLSFDDILEAVQDSKRGRWFLNEYEQRLSKKDTSSILQAIAKLEARMDGFGAQSSQPDDLVKVKAAIATARHDLLKLGVGKDALSAEGQLFANLADMARKAIPSTDSNAGIVRTLQLVAEIDKTISPAAMEDRGAKFFGADEKLFERTATPTKPVLVTLTPAADTPPAPVAEAKPATIIEKPPAPQKDEPIATGAKLIIRKSSAKDLAESVQTQDAAVDAVVESFADMTPPAPLSTAMDDVTKIDSPRIVIIRRKAEDMPEVEEASSAA
jgi:hypothetical protein